MDINRAWRDILSSENQRTILTVLKINLISVLLRAKKLDFVKLKEEDLDGVKTCNELTRIREACIWQTYGQDGIKLSDIKQKFRSCARTNDTQAGIDSRDARRIVNLIDVLSNATHTLLYFRNLEAHELNPIDDPGHAAALAGVVLHLTEQLAPQKDPLKASVEKLRATASSVLQLCSAFYEEDDEKQEDSYRGPTPPEEEKEDRDILLEKLEELRSEWERDIKTLIQRVPDEEKLRAIASEVVDQSVKKFQDTLHQSGSAPEDRRDDFEGFLELPIEEESDDFETSGSKISPSPTPIQAKNSLIALRNRISDEFRWNNIPIENWENVLQRPIIGQMIEEKITDVEQWRKAGGTIKERYTDERNRSKAMDKQLEKYGKEIFDIMQSIDWMDERELHDLDDEVPF